MVEIHTLSVADFKHTMQDNDLYDCNIELRTDLAVISIGNSFEDGSPDDIFSNGPSSRWFRYQHKNVLNLTFDDITSPEKWQMMSQFAKQPVGSGILVKAGFPAETVCCLTSKWPVSLSISWTRTEQQKYG